MSLTMTRNVCVLSIVVCIGGLPACGGPNGSRSGPHELVGDMGPAPADTAPADLGPPASDAAPGCPAATPNACPAGDGAICTNFAFDPANCGACGTTCNEAGGEFCDHGRCDCGPLADCGGTCVDSKVDPANCGACGHTCDRANGEECVDGACTLQCTGGQKVCSGTCTDVAGDAHNCGGCGISCDGACTSGLCFCDPFNGTDLTSDVDNCGACYNRCTQLDGSAGGSCVQGACYDLQHDGANCGSVGTACAGGTSCCGGGCADTQNEVAHCGDCYTSCLGNETCQAGVCGHFGSCGGANVDLNRDPNNCGGCGIVCSGGTPVCEVGTCSDGDAYFDKVELLMHFDNDFSDVKGHTTATVYNSPTFASIAGTVGSESAHFHEPGGGIFNDQALAVQGGQLLSVHTHDFTLEMMLYLESWNCAGDEQQSNIINFAKGYPDPTGFMLMTQPSPDYGLVFGGLAAGTQLTTSSANISLGQWNHVAVVRASGTTSLYVNGVQAASVPDTADYSFADTGYFSAQFNGPYHSLCGYIDEFRLTNGVARYKGPSFTVPAMPLPSH